MEVIPLDSQHGLASLLAGLIIAICLHLVVKIVNMVINMVKNLREADGKKLDHLTTSMNENTKAVYVLNESMKQLNNRVVETDISSLKNEQNLSRLVATVRELAGDRWVDIQKKIREEEFLDPERT